jgi:prepilin-type N-terminal cleavage/methylation domain-containing protein
MSLNNIKQLKKDRGFTIVELLIVIVIIGILAAITIVAYNGVQARANNSAAQAAGSTLAKKAEAFNAVQTNYPTSTADFNSVAESKLDSGLAIGTPSAANGKNTVEYATCATPTGYRVNTWDFGANALSTTPKYGGGATSASTCTVRA